jgi:hypothetical protein
MSELRGTRNTLVTVLEGLLRRRIRLFRSSPKPSGSA